MQRLAIATLVLGGRQQRLKAFGAASDVQSGIVHEIATVAAPDDSSTSASRPSGARSR